MSKINEKQWRYLNGAYKRGSFSQAYLFIGPEKTGKYKVVEQFIRLINEIDDKKDLGIDPDIFIIEPEIEKKKGKIRKKKISIDQTREVLKKASYHAYKAPYKIILIKEAETMTTSAGNSLLKVIEEPKEDTMVILISHKEQRILPTIQSRCQLVRFGLSNEKVVSDTLEEKFPEEDKGTIEQCALLSRGRIELAQQYLEKKELRDNAKQFQEEFRKALKGDLMNGFLLIEKVKDDKNKVLEMMDQWVWYLHDFLNKCIDDEQEVKIIEKVHEILSQVTKLKYDIEHSNVNHKLQLENFFVQLS